MTAKRDGPKYGKHMKAISVEVASFDQAQIATIEEEGSYTLNIGSEELVLEYVDFIISSDDIEGWLVASDKGLTVALDIHISDDLKAEGNAREFVNRVQNLRKESNLDVTDKIVIKMLVNDDFKPSLDKYKNYICTEILATDIELISILREGQSIEVNDMNLEIELIKK